MVQSQQKKNVAAPSLLESADKDDASPSPTDEIWHFLQPSRVSEDTSPEDSKWPLSHGLALLCLGGCALWALIFGVLHFL
jgi:hypothetical protein